MPGLLLKSRVRVIVGFTSYALLGLVITILVGNNLSLSSIWINVLFLGIAWVFLSAGVYVLNDICDISLDKISESERPLVTNDITKNEAIVAVIAFLSLSFIFSAQLGLLTLLIFLTCMGLGIVYSIPPIHLKRRIFGKQLTLGISAALSILAGGSAFGYFPSVLIYAILVIFPFMSISTVIADLKDIKADTSADYRTLAIALGAKKSIDLAIYGLVAMIGLAVPGVIYFNLNPAFLLIILPLLGLNLKRYLEFRNSNVDWGEYKKLLMLHKISGPLFQLGIVIGLIF